MKLVSARLLLLWSAMRSAPFHQLKHWNTNPHQGTISELRDAVWQICNCDKDFLSLRKTELIKHHPHKRLPLIHSDYERWPSRSLLTPGF